MIILINNSPNKNRYHKVYQVRTDITALIKDILFNFNKGAVVEEVRTFFEKRNDVSIYIPTFT